MKDYFISFYRLLFPARCPSCGDVLHESDNFLCIHCKWDMPLTNYWNDPDNPIAQKFWGLIPLKMASSLFFYSVGNKYQKLIHNIKYNNNFRSARMLGIIMGNYMKDSGLYEGIDVIVPIPLHNIKFIQRGYNQALYIAKGVAEVLDCSIDNKSVIRTKNSKSQTKQIKSERWKNVERVFTVRTPEKLKGKHILIVDDVLTTGATIESFANEILKATSHDCVISIATLGVSSYELFKNNK